MDPIEFINKASTEQMVFSCKLLKTENLMQQLSLPPRRHLTLHVEFKKWFKSHQPNSDASNTFKFIDASREGIKFDLDKSYIACAHPDENMLIISYIVEADSEVTQLCMEMVSVPSGWTRMTGGGWVYPIKENPKCTNWYDTFKNELRCTKTKRPALLCKNENIKMDIKQIIPPDAEDRMAPYGDGKFEITVENTNLTDPVEVPALLVNSDTNEISWDDSLIIVDAEEGEAYVPNNAGNQENLKPMTLEPQSKVQGIIDCLTLEGQDYWKMGGTRVYLRFCLGEMVKENFFYYYTNAHERLHQDSLGKQTIHSK